MNHKITFQELIDAIAEQSGKSKEFTHDFIKDMTSIIRESLEKDRNINIAGLGKFELKKMDEREGYNPETDENITIPAHNKIDFTPYKDLRELVNAPYSHMEPEIIEGEKEVEDKTAPAEDQEKAEEETPGDQHRKKKAPWEEDMESEIEVDEDDPFGLNAKHKGKTPYSIEDKPNREIDIDETEDEGDDEEDVVEFGPGIAPEGSNKYEEPTEETEEPEAKKEERIGKPKAEEKVASEKEKAASFEPKTYTKKPSFRDRSHRRQKTGGAFWIIAAAFIILLLAIGAWYLIGSQQEAAQDNMATETQAVQNEDNAVEQNQQDEEEAAVQPEPEEDAVDETADEDATQSGDAGQQADSQAQQAADPTAVPPVETITVSAGQTLWGLADNEYENPYLWPWIYDTNKSSIDNPDIIYVGQSLDIPQRRGQNNQLSNSDSLLVALGYVETYLWYKENNLENARFYLYAAKKYHNRVFEYTDATIDEADLRFANRAQ